MRCYGPLSHSVDTTQKPLPQFVLNIITIDKLLIRLSDQGLEDQHRAENWNVLIWSAIRCCSNINILFKDLSPVPGSKS